MAGATSTTKLPPAFIFFFLLFRLNFLIVSFLRSLSFFMRPGERWPPREDLLLTLET